MKKLLLLTPELPFPPQSGGKVKSLKLLEAMTERYAVTLASPLKLEDASYLDQFLERSPCTQHVHEPVQVPRSAKNLIASYIKGQPLNVHRSHCPKLAAQVRELAPQHDLILLDHYEASIYLPNDYQGTVIYHAHNAYHQLWNRYARLPGNPAVRLAAFVEAHRVRRAELGIAERADLVFAAPNDAETLMQFGVAGDKIAHTYHLGDDSQLALPELRFEKTEKKLMYVGFLGWEANVVGLVWFLENVWPSLLENHPDLRFDIVGKNPDKRLKEAAAIYPGIQLHGFVEDLQEVYESARVSVAPLLFGSGMKVKVLDAMARGIPTVTTPVGAEGVEYVNNQHLAVATSAEEMASATLKLLEDSALWNRMCRSSRELIGERYTWRQLFNGMHDAIDNVVYRRESIPTEDKGDASARSESTQTTVHGSPDPVLQHV
ncbi:MAG: glycosyltransferase [Pseudomonadota bacterium]